MLFNKQDETCLNSIKPSVSRLTVSETRPHVSTAVAMLVEEAYVTLKEGSTVNRKELEERVLSVSLHEDLGSRATSVEEDALLYLRALLEETGITIIQDNTDKGNTVLSRFNSAPLLVTIGGIEQILFPLMVVSSILLFLVLLFNIFFVGISNTPQSTFNFLSGLSILNVVVYIYFANHVKSLRRGSGLPERFEVFAGSL